MAETQVQQCPDEIISPSADRRTRRRRRRSSGSSSFEFCVLRKPSLLSADQLFSDGVLLPLHRLQHPSVDDPSEFEHPDSARAEQPELAPEPNHSSGAEQPELIPEPKQLDSACAEETPELIPEPKLPDSSGAEQPELAPEPKQPDSYRAEQPGLAPESHQPDSSGSELALEPNQPGSSRAEEPELAPESGPEISAAMSDSSSGVFSFSKRWREIFKKSDKKSANGGENCSKKAKKEKKSGIFGANGLSAAERILNINIWPFRRTKLASAAGAPPVVSGLSSPKVSSPPTAGELKLAAGGARPVVSGLSSPSPKTAPCSRGNYSPGEFKTRKPPGSPKGRSSLVWQARRSGGAGGRSYGFLTKSADNGMKRDGNYVEKSFRRDGNKGWRKVSPAAADGGSGGWHKARVLAMNDSMCTDAPGGDGVSGEGVRVNLRNLFKVH